MTSLPPGQSSALGALNQAASSNRVVQGFDWGAIVTAARPGDKTPEQRQQALRLERIQADLRTWGQRFGLLQEHVQASAVFAVTATPSSTPEAETLLAAKLIYWIYCLDTLVDKRDLRFPQELATIATDLAIARRPLTSILGRQGSAHHQEVGEARASLLALGLESALQAFFIEATEHWDTIVEARRLRQYRSRLIANQLAACIAAMEQEVQWSYDVLYAEKHEKLPTLASYLAVAERSIGVHPVAAIITTFCRSSRQIWRTYTPCIDVAAQVIRLTNDMSTFAIDVQENHLSAMALIMTVAQNQHLLASEEQARAQLRSQMHKALVQFVQYIEGFSETPLAYFLTHIIAFSLAIYGDGN